MKSGSNKQTPGLRPRRGQGAFEYTILVAIVLATVVIAFVILRAGILAPVNQQLTQSGSAYAAVVSAELALGLNPPLQIISLNLSNYTYNTATVDWITSRPANSTFLYGLSPGSYAFQLSDSAQNNSHTIFVTGLTPVTAYYAQASSCNATGVCVSSPEFNFTTPASPLPPVILNVSVSTTSDNATVTWQTDYMSTSQVEYGLYYGGFTGLLNDPSAVLAHSVFLSPLTPNTTYYYRVTSCGTIGGCNVSSIRSFTTNASPLGPLYFNSTDFNFTPVLQTGVSLAANDAGSGTDPYAALNMMFLLPEYLMNQSTLATPSANLTSNDAGSGTDPYAALGLSFLLPEYSINSTTTVPGPNVTAG